MNDVEQIRVVDSAMKEKWKNLEISQQGNTKVRHPYHHGVYTINCFNILG